MIGWYKLWINKNECSLSAWQVCNKLIPYLKVIYKDFLKTFKSLDILNIVSSFIAYYQVSQKNWLRSHFEFLAWESK